MKKIIYMFFIFFINTIFVKADNMVNIHFFHLDDCKYCNSELELLDFIEDNYSNVKVYKYEISDKDNNELFNNITHLLNVNTSGVPFTIIGDTYYFGFDKRNSKKTFIATIEYYLKNDYNDIVNEYVNNNTITVSENNDNLLNYISNYGNHVLNLPFGLKVNTNDLEINFNILLISMLNFFSNYYLYICLFILLFINRNSKRNTIIFGILMGIVNIILLIFKGNYLLIIKDILYLSGISNIICLFYILLYFSISLFCFILLYLLFILIIKKKKTTMN